MIGLFHFLLMLYMGYQSRLEAAVSNLGSPDKILLTRSWQTKSLPPEPAPSGRFFPRLQRWASNCHQK
jgi:hypothetical protein